LNYSGSSFEVGLTKDPRVDFKKSRIKKTDGGNMFWDGFLKVE
jgi:hypothetical protein